MTIDNLLHRLWTKAHDHPHYNKKQWQVLAAFIEANQGHTTPLQNHNHVGLVMKKTLGEECVENG
jgi:hypothetical protein